MNLAPTLPRAARRGIALVAVAAVGLTALSGCLEYDEKIKIEADGSGTYELKFKMDMSEIKKAFGPMGEDDGGADDLPSEKEMREKFSGEGVTVEKLVVEPIESGMKMHVIFKFESIEALNQIEGWKDDGRDLRVKKLEDGSYELAYSWDASKSGEDLGVGGDTPKTPGGGGGDEMPPPGGGDGMGGDDGMGNPEDLPGDEELQEFEAFSEKMKALEEKLAKQIEFKISITLPNAATAEEPGKAEGKTVVWDFSPKSNPDQNIMSEIKKFNMKAKFGGAGVTIK